jgi:hypothetical protein
VITPAQPVDPTSYYSFIDLTTFHHGAGRRNKSSRSRKHTRSRRHLHVVDRPISFLDLGESDARILDHPPNTNRPRLSSSDPISIGGTTGHGPSFSAWSAPRSRDLLLSTIAPDSLRTSLCLEVDQLPPYEEAAGSAPVYLVENTVRRIASRNSRSSYRIDRAKVALPPSSQDPMSPPLIRLCYNQLDRHSVIFAHYHPFHHRGKLMLFSQLPPAPESSLCTSPAKSFSKEIEAHHPSLSDCTGQGFLPHNRDVLPSSFSPSRFVGERGDVNATTDGSTLQRIHQHRAHSSIPR